MAKRIYVGNLPWSYASSDLEALFKEYGDVAAAEVIMDRETGRSLQDGFRRVWKSSRNYLAHWRPRRSIADQAVIAGSEDPLIDWRFLEESGARVTRLPGAHAFHYSNPSKLAEAIAAELQRGAGLATPAPKALP